MKIRIATALLALTLPLAAQAPASAETEAMFYKAFWLEKGERDIVGAMALYEQFLAKAPEHKLAKQAAVQQFGLLTSTGKVKEREAFKAKYESLLGNVASAGAAAERPATGDAEPGARGARGARGAGGAAGRGRMDPAAHMADLEKQLASAKEEGDDEAVKRLEQEIARTKQMAERGARGQGGAGQGGPGRRGGGLAGVFGGKKLADMTADELETFKKGITTAEPMLDRMRQNMDEEQAKKLDTNLADLKKGLEGNKLDDAQKALDGIRASLPQRRRGGDAAGNGGGGRGGNNGGGSSGGGGGTNGGGGGGTNGGGGGGTNGGGGGGTNGGGGGGGTNGGGGGR